MLAYIKVKQVYSRLLQGHVIVASFVIWYKCTLLHGYWEGSVSASKFICT